MPHVLHRPLRTLEMLTCEACGHGFRLTGDERREILARSLPPPERCADCRDAARRADEYRRR